MVWRQPLKWYRQLIGWFRDRWRGHEHNFSCIRQVKTIRKYKARMIGKVFKGQCDPPIYNGRVELDSHADTFVAGRNCILMHYTERVCDVMPYSDDYESKTAIPIVKAATGYTSSNGRRYILVFNEAIWMPDLHYSLMNPNQLRDYGVEVQDNPYHKDPMIIQSGSDLEQDGFIACLRSEGTTIYMDSWTPTTKDLDRYPHVELTSNLPWNPHEVRFPSTDQQTIDEIEERNISTISRVDTRVIFDVRTFNARIMKSQKVFTRMTEGPLSEDQIMGPRIFVSTDRHSNTTPEDLSEIWGISVEQARMTLDSTTQHHVRSAVLPLSRRYRMDRMYEPKRLRCDMASDTMDPRCPGLHGNRYIQVFGNKDMFAEAIPITSKGDCHLALKKFINEFGAPDKMITDGSREQMGQYTQFQKILRKHNIISVSTQPHRPNQNPSETVIRELRKRWYRAIFRTNCPRALWNYGLPHFARLMSLTATNANEMNGRTPLEKVTGETPDISQYLDFGWYDWVWYKENAGLDVPRLGRFLGIADSSSNMMTFHVLPESGIVVRAGTVQRVTKLELDTDAVRDRVKQFNGKMADKFKEQRLAIEGDKPDIMEWEDLLDDDVDFADEFARVYNNQDVPESDDQFDPDSFDQYLSMEVAIDRGGEHPQLARVTKRLKDHRGNPIGVSNNNPMLDTRMYEVEFTDGYKQAMSANVIAENMFATVDEEGRRHLLMDSIMDVRKSKSAVLKQDAFITSSNGTRRRRETTKGWEVLVAWRDGSTTWNALKDVKDSYPVELAEFAIDQRIDDEPAFAWWVPFVLKKKARIIAKIKSTYWSRTHKYGIRIPKSVREAIEIDNQNNNTLWWDALMKEMRNVRPAFEEYEGEVSQLVGYQKIKCHVVWDIKLGENFRRKARLVAGGHTTAIPETMTYSSVVSRDSVRIALTIAALNGLDILACDIQNAYLSAPCREKVYCIAGPEFGSDAGKIMVVKMALYGLRSSGASFRSMLANTIWDLEYRPSKADPDVWLKPSSKPSGERYYSMILCYVDDVISISHCPMEAIRGIKATFKLKGDKADVPEMYLGGGLAKVRTDLGVECWTLSSEKYLKTAIQNVESKLAESGQRLPAKCVTPFSSHYHPSTDTSRELDSDGVRYFQELIGVLRWAIELGRVDILLEVSLLSTHLALPRIGHLTQVYHIFSYLKTSPRRRLFFDPTSPLISQSRFRTFEWVDFYKDAKEEIPFDMPEPLGKEVSIHCFVDASHASDVATRRSQSGILIFINRSPIVFYSKRQNSVETSTFGSEFTAMKQAVELVKALRYKLRMFGVPIDGEAAVYCDNEAVYKNVSNPASVLNKKMHAISYHYCREAVAAGVIKIAKEDTETNLSDLFTKVLSQDRREFLLGKFIY